MAQILVVDEEERIRGVIEAALGNDYVVHHARDGEEALEVLAREPVDLVVVDLGVLRMDGGTPIRQLRQAGTRVKILATAGADAETLAGALESGADCTLGRPFHQDELRAVVRGLIGRADSSRDCG